MDYSVFSSGVFVGRIWNPLVKGPSVVTVRDGHVIDITSKEVPTVRDLLELEDPTAFVGSASGRTIGAIADILGSKGNRSLNEVHMLAPCDLQAIKACGVTFARSMIERVIEERAAGNPDLAASIRKKVAAVIGYSLQNLKAGSDQAAKVKEVLTKEGVWSQYLEVGIGPDAEVFTKSQVMSSVGTTLVYTQFRNGRILSLKLCLRSILPVSSEARPLATMLTFGTSRDDQRFCLVKRKTTTHRARSAPSSDCSTMTTR